MRKSILVAAATLAVAATGLVVVARPTEAALSDVPADCSVSTAAYRSDGQRLTYVYSGKTTSTKAYVNDKLGWVPSAHQQTVAPVTTPSSTAASTPRTPPMVTSTC